MPGYGNAVIDFGATPGLPETSVDVIGLVNILSGSQVEAFIQCSDSTPDHSSDEHRIEDIKLCCGNIVPATGFTIYAECRKGRAVGQFKVQWIWA